MRDFAEVRGSTETVVAAASVDIEDPNVPQKPYDLADPRRAIGAAMGE